MTFLFVRPGSASGREGILVYEDVFDTITKFEVLVVPVMIFNIYIYISRYPLDLGSHETKKWQFRTTLSKDLGR
jgi:hypothetical protein